MKCFFFEIIRPIREQKKIRKSPMLYFFSGKLFSHNTFNNIPPRGVLLAYISAAAASLLIFQGVFDLGKVEFFSGSPFEDVEDILAGGLEVRRGIVRLADEELGVDAVLVGGVDVADLQELLLDRTQEGHAGLDLVLRVGRLHVSRHHGHEPVLRGNLVRVAHHRHVNVRLPVDLLLGDDDLGG